MAAASGAIPIVAQAAAVVKRTPTALPKYRVVSGDTLSAVGVRFSRTWPALGFFNRIPDPNLIYVDQVLTIPPASFVAPASYGAAPAAAPAPAPTPPAPPVHYNAPVRTYTPPPQPVVSSYSAGGIWGCIAYHESGGNPATNTGNGYYGMYQDTIGSWQAAGGPPGLPSDYSAAVQTQVNQRIQAQQGWGAWPNTSRMCGA